MKLLGEEAAKEEGFVVYDGVSFPGVAVGETGERGAAEAAAWASANRAFLEEGLTRHGTLLFRGLSLKTPEEFQAFIGAFEGLNFSMEAPIGGGGPRLNVIGPVHTSTESPPEFRIPFHHELAYITSPPTKLFFWCEIEPQADGETPVLLSSIVVDRITRERPQFVERLRDYGVKYVRTLEPDTGKYQRGWRDAFQAETKEAAERNAELCGTEKVEFLPGDRMRVTSTKFDAIVQDPRKGDLTWFNAVCLLHPAAHGKESGNDGADDAGKLWDVTYGDGSPIDAEDVIAAKRIMDESGTQFRWRQGDVLVVDNMLALHSRNSFTPPRRILVAMTN